MPLLRKRVRSSTNLLRLLLAQRAEPGDGGRSKRVRYTKERMQRNAEKGYRQMNLKRNNCGTFLYLFKRARCLPGRITRGEPYALPTFFILS
jgi:hypothetical protein